MRCKIIEIGPEDAFCNDIERFRGAKGYLERGFEMRPRKWLSGRFTFDHSLPSTLSALDFSYIKVQPIE